MNKDAHHRRRHVRHQSDGTVTPVRDATVKNRGRKADGSSRNTSNRGALANMVTSDDNFDADDVVFAFEYPEWSSHGFRRADAAPWMAHGIDHENAAVWRDAGHNADYANEWRPAPQGRLIPAADALAFITNGVPDQIARQFWSTVIPVDEAVQWHAGGISAHDAITWRSRNITPEGAQEHIALGLSDPAELRFIDTLGQKMAHRWYQEGVRLATASLYQELFADGHRIKRIAPVIKSKHTGTIDDHYEWIESPIPDNQLVEFAEKGYTVHRAKQLYAKGQTSASVPDLYNGELVPGKSWAGIRQAMEAEATRGNYDIQMSAEDRSWFRQVEVTLTHKSDPTNRKTYRLRFSHTGAFEQANSDVKRKTRVVKTKAEFLRLHFPDSQN